MNRAVLVFAIALLVTSVIGCQKEHSKPDDRVQPTTVASTSSVTWVDVPNEVCDAGTRHGKEEGEKIARDFGEAACLAAGKKYADELRCEGHAQVKCR